MTPCSIAQVEQSARACQWKCHTEWQGNQDTEKCLTISSRRRPSDRHGCHLRIVPLRQAHISQHLEKLKSKQHTILVCQPQHCMSKEGRACPLGILTGIRQVMLPPRARQLEGGGNDWWRDSIYALQYSIRLLIKHAVPAFGHRGP